MKKKILIIDDDEFMSGLYGTLLVRAGHDVSYERTGSAGLRAAAKNNPDLILLDVIMPEMSGFDTLVRLKSGELTKSIPVIMLTGITNELDAKKGLTLGAVAYLTKTTVMPADALEKIEEVLKDDEKASRHHAPKKKH